MRERAQMRKRNRIEKHDAGRKHGKRGKLSTRKNKMKTMEKNEQHGERSKAAKQQCSMA